MQYGMWAYPWDLVDEGPGDALERLQSLGVDEVNLATNYHSVQAFLPHNPERRTFFANASAYFRPDDRYGALEPVPNETMGDDDWVATVARAAADADVALNSWTVGCHNSRLGAANPEATLVSPHGDSLVFGLCPSNPSVRRYLTDLVADLAGREWFERIELETFDYFYGTGFGWHHEKYHAELGRLGEFLFGVCFCDHCRENAADAGVDVARAREACRDAVDAIAGGTLDPHVDAAGWLLANPTVAAYLDVRAETLRDLFGDLAAAASGADLGYYVGHLDAGDAWMHGVDPAGLDDMVDYVTVLAYESSREAAVTAFETVDALTGDVSLHAGVLPGHPVIDDGDTVRDVVNGLEAAGAERVSFYNYGMLPERNLAWIASAADGDTEAAYESD